MSKSAGIEEEIIIPLVVYKPYLLDIKVWDIKV
jgi:hypothetical protein